MIAKYKKYGELFPVFFVHDVEPKVEGGIIKVGY
jgi:hypothetical protein